ncbi:glycosyl hydrolase [Aspergillus pseudodeflectus]|uniref:Glycosyl hydrolase n=1 Tax=Aspergillus pseudodeflectus TaxID=176178 RepID=A0ABR4KAU0_9EURO
MVFNVLENPIIPGFAPDPSIVRIGEEYFLVTSSFHLFPGLPIYCSKDLVSWTHIGNAINRTSQLSLTGASTLLHNFNGPSKNRIVGTGGLWAPTIRHYRGTIYIVGTNAMHIHNNDDNVKPDIEFANFIIHTYDIHSDNWSDPIFFDFWGIDPDLFFDDDGRAYVSGSSWKTDPGTIDCFEIDLETGRKVSQQQHGRWYYILASEGGTHEDHQISIARSESIWGPFEGCPNNPILTPSSARPDQYIQYNGHGDLFQDEDGEWFLVWLAARRDPDGRCIMGRETFLTPMQWSHGSWPVIEQPLALDRAPSEGIAFPRPLRPNLDFVWIRDPDLACYEVLEDGRIIKIRPSARDINERIGHISFVGKRQRILVGQATVTLRTASDSLFAAKDVVAGLAYYKDEHRYARIAFDYTTSTIFVEAKKADGVSLIQARTGGLSVEMAEGVDINFCIRYTEKSLAFGYSARNISQNGWIFICTMDTLDLTDRDFTGPCVGIFSAMKAACASGGVTVTFVDISVHG